MVCLKRHTSWPASSVQFHFSASVTCLHMGFGGSSTKTQTRSQFDQGSNGVMKISTERSRLLKSKTPPTRSTSLKQSFGILKGQSRRARRVMPLEFEAWNERQRNRKGRCNSLMGESPAPDLERDCSPNHPLLAGVFHARLHSTANCEPRCARCNR